MIFFAAENNNPRRNVYSPKSPSVQVITLHVITHFSPIIMLVLPMPQRFYKCLAVNVSKIINALSCKFHKPKWDMTTYLGGQ